MTIEDKSNQLIRQTRELYDYIVKRKQDFARFLTEAEYYKRIGNVKLATSWDATATETAKGIYEAETELAERHAEYERCINEKRAELKDVPYDKVATHEWNERPELGA